MTGGTPTDILKSILVAGILGLVLAATGCAPPPPEFRDGKVHDIKAGEAFGVRIGEPSERAVSTVKKRIKGGFRDNPPQCHGRADWYCDGADAVYEYDARTTFAWGGTVELFITNGRVSRIRWWQHTLDL